MSDVTVSQTSPETTEDHEKTLNQVFAEINLLNQQMQPTRAEIDQLKMASARLEAETRSILSRLKAMV